MMENVSSKLVLTRWLGRFGNRLFTYVFANHLASRFGLTIYAPSEWEGSTLFREAAEWRVITNDLLRLKVNQCLAELDTIEYRRRAVEEYNRKSGDSLRMADLEEPSEYGCCSNVAFEALCCWDSWIFAKYTRQELLSYLEFSDEVKSSEVYRFYESLQGTYDVAHVRRDDITFRTDHSGYSVISLDSYRRAFEKFDCDPDLVVLVSDDDSLRTPRLDFHDSPRENNWNYPFGQDPMPEVFYPFFQDFLKMIFARRLFRANSSFSWWAAFLSKGQVYSPILQDRIDYPTQRREIHCEFEEGNEPHWFYLKGEECDRIVIRDAARQLQSVDDARRELSSPVLAGQYGLGDVVMEATARIRPAPRFAKP
jgi:hypothetical protein